MPRRYSRLLPGLQFLPPVGAPGTRFLHLRPIFTRASYHTQAIEETENIGKLRTDGQRVVKEETDMVRNKTVNLDNGITDIFLMISHSL